MPVLEDMLSQLEIRAVDALYGHEETISRSLKRLKEGMLNIGQLVDPLIVDGKTGVVLDGNHRLKVLEIIECPYAVCQVVNYSSPEIRVGTWHPSLKISKDELLQLDSIKCEKVDRETGLKAVNELRSPAMAIIPDGECYLINPGNYKIKEMIEEQRYLLGLIENRQPQYIPDEEIERHRVLGETVFYRRAYTKGEIIAMATAHSPLPPKSTRHLIPGRIIRLNMRLGWLHLDKESAWKELVGMLKKRAYNGNVRKYYEPVIVIY
ncbi:MAG: hypothetical protein QXT05_01510 [Candidatus Bilamarchaeaceae archaeon]